MEMDHECKLDIDSKQPQSCEKVPSPSSCGADTTKGGSALPTLSEADVKLHFRKQGMAWIKPEYIAMRPQNNDCVTGPPAKKQKTSGRNRNRPIERGPPPSQKICPSIIKEKQCNYGSSCKFSHDIKKFMCEKPSDIGKKCYVFEMYGRCPQAIACRYGSEHIDSDFKNIINKQLHDNMANSPTTINYLDKVTQRLLWKRKYDFTKANDRVSKVQTLYNQKRAAIEQAIRFDEENVSETVNLQEDHLRSGSCNVNIQRHSADETRCSPLESYTGNKYLGDSSAVCVSVSGNSIDSVQSKTFGCFTDEDLIKLRPTEIKKVDFCGKLFLAPLTTVGNLPFRRICKGFGADITCSEMAVATKLLQANQSEWALLKRHQSEDLFGIQVCGAYADTLTRCAQLLTEVTSLDFLDINCGCPIDLVFKRGEGSALLAKPNRLEQIVKSMTMVLDVPLTLKMRTGIMNDKPIAHNIIPKLHTWGVSQVTLHGRSREQRYTRLADWNYISQCAQLAAPMPVFGNGDILSYEDYYEHLDNTAVSGIMIARGALIKPWIFTEIKERRHWDISSTERLEILKDFVNFGLEHWGSDQQGVENVRKFLMEQLSFSYRYIPVELLERLPQRVNERPPYYRGRNDMETLLSSPNCSDWIKISEMLLGPVPKDFLFLPKHKANAFK